MGRAAHGVPVSEDSNRRFVACAVVRMDDEGISGVLELSAAARAMVRIPLQLTDGRSVNVQLVQGGKFSALIDSGPAYRSAEVVSALRELGVDNLRYIINTVCHHEHIGGNSAVQDAFGAMIVAPSRTARWQEDSQRYYSDYILEFPDLIEDTSQLRESVFNSLGEPRAVDIHGADGMVLNLGGDVLLRAVAFPGHAADELGWYEPAKRSLILGPVIPRLETTFLDSQENIRAYRQTLEKISGLVQSLGLERIRTSCYDEVGGTELVSIVEWVSDHLDRIEATLIQVLATRENASLEELWHEACLRLGREADYRSLHTINAHLMDFVASNIAKEISANVYELL